MTDMSEEKVETVQRVVERVESWEYSAEDGRVEQQLREGLQEAGVELEDAQVQQLVDAISHGQGPVQVSEVLG